MTARAITETELGKLRSEEQWSELFLAIHKPAVIYSARVNQATFGTPITQVTYDGGSGTLANVKEGMTLYIGSSAGAYDKGMLRIRKAPSATVFYVGESAEIDWEDDDYLTVVNEFGLWSRHPVIRGNTSEMDYDVDYSDQHTNLDPVPVLGPPAVLWLTGTTVTFNPDASDSWVLGSTISSYLWVATGASATANLDTATPTITYNAVGQYRVDCTVTAANGKTTTGYRMVFVYSAASMPITQFELQNCSGDLESGGWQFSVKLYDQVAIADVRERALVVLFAKDHYNGVQESLGAVTGYENIIAIGWIKQEDFEVSPEFSTVNFTVYGPQQWLKEIPGYPVGMEYVASGSAVWTDMDDLTVDRALWHLLHWRSTATLCMDITLSGETSLASAMEAPTGSLWDQLVTMSKEVILATPACNRYGQLYVQVDIPYMEEADRASLPTVMEVLSSDWQDTLNIERQPTPRVAMVEASGISFDGTTATPLFSRAPGDVLSRYGSFINQDRLLLYDQDFCNDICADIYAHENNEYPNIDFSLASNNRFIDIVPRQRLTISIGELNIPRGIVWTNKKILPIRVSYTHDAKTGILSTSVETKAETSGELIGVVGVTKIPPQPVEENIDPGGYDPGDFPIFPEPNINFPPYVPTPPPTDPWCLTTANGPYGLLWDKSEIVSSDNEDERTAKVYYPCNIRDTGNHVTMLVFHGRFYRWSSVYNSWEAISEETEGGYYTFDAIDSNGNVIATASGVNQIDVDTRAYIFSVGGNANIWGFRLRIDEEGGSGYGIGDVLASGTINGNDSDGAIIKADATIGNWYVVESSGGPINFGTDVEGDFRSWIPTLYFGYAGKPMPGYYINTELGINSYASGYGSLFSYWVKIGSYHSRVWFKTNSVEINYRFGDSDYENNSGTLGYTLSEGTAPEGYKIEIYGLSSVYNICPVQ